MTPAKFRLVLTASLFLAWLGYLVFLIATRPVRGNGDSLVVSRAQILASEIDVVVEITDPNEDAVVNIYDLYAFDQGVGSSCANDVDQDGDVDAADRRALRNLVRTGEPADVQTPR